MWSGLLRESSKRSQNLDSSIIFFGDENCGKNEVIEKISANTELNEPSAAKEIFHYNYFDVEDGYLENSARINFWSFTEKMHSNAFEIVGNNKSDRVVFQLTNNLKFISFINIMYILFYF
jgi:hypothetical protein